MNLVYVFAYDCVLWCDFFMLAIYHWVSYMYIYFEIPVLYVFVCTSCVHMFTFYVSHLFCMCICFLWAIDMILYTLYVHIHVMLAAHVFMYMYERVLHIYRYIL